MTETPSLREALEQAMTYWRRYAASYAGRNLETEEDNAEAAMYRGARAALAAHTPPAVVPHETAAVTDNGACVSSVSDKPADDELAAIRERCETLGGEPLYRCLDGYYDPWEYTFLHNGGVSRADALALLSHLSAERARAERLEAEVETLRANRDALAFGEKQALEAMAAEKARAERMRERLKTVAHMIQNDLVTEAYHHAIQEDN